jgi:dTDP-4-dehydrorhamnose reductase
MHAHKLHKILVTGSNGQLGTEFKTIAPNYSDYEFVFVTKLELDVRLQHHVEHVMELHKPAAVINCAAYTNVELAQHEHEAATEINTLGPKYLAMACKEHEALLIHFSTDYVFDGKKHTPYKETDEVNPLNFYGHSKLEGERLVDEVFKRYFIIRASWLYSTYGHNFYKTMLRLAKERPDLNVVNDQISAPTYARMLAEDVMMLLEKTIIQTNSVDHGIYHYSPTGQASWFEFAREIMAAHNQTIAVNAMSSHEFITKAMRPAYSKLDASRFEKALGKKMKSWQDGLKQCVKNEY